ncbi:MAG: host specificity factor TipJ family phage tail protein [Comamonas thiooxydans]
MEVNRAESAAVAAVGGVPADVLDTAGRLVVTPNALTLDGQRNVPADLQPGESLASFLDRHVPGIDSGAWTVMIGGAVVPQAMWVHTFPKHGQLIACRAVLRKSALQLVAIAALSYFTMGAGAGWIAGSFGVSAGVAGAIGLGMFMAGSVLINKVLAPKIPSAQSLAQKQIYSLSDQRNTARPYEPIPVLWGEMRVTPDLASKSYAWYEGDDQYMSTILLGGINVQEAFDLAIGDTPIGNFSDVGLYFNGFPGMPSQNVPLYSNVDALAGAEFVNGGDWITRTGSAGAAALQVDIEGQLYAVYSKSGVGANSVGLTIQARQVGASSWNTMLETTLSNASQDALRRTYSFDVAPGQYEVRAKLGVPHWTDPQDVCRLSWVSLKSVQADTADYSQWGRIGIKIRASGQLSGSLDQVRATYRAKPMPIWTGSGWATATTRADGLSNPGAILLQTLRGVWVTDSQGQRVLQFGFGLSDEQIDIEGLKAFMLHCAARGYTYDKWVTSSMSLGAFCEEVALAGMGEFAWTDGSRPTAVFVTSGQPNSAVVNMANMLKGGFSVDYALSNAADGIEYQWLNRDTWEMTTLRVMAPGVTTMLSPARVTGEGITSEAHAAVMARYHLAQSLYQYKTVHYTADIEHLDYRRLSVLSVSHDLTQWGFGGRLVSARRAGGQVQLTLDEPVPPLATPYIGLRVPGGRDYRVWPVQQLATESDVVTLVGEWPAGVAFPGEDLGNPAHDTLWCYDFKATPGYRVRVTGIDPESDLKGARITAVPEGPEFWDYVFNGTYVPAPNQSSIPQLGRPVVKNLRVSEKVNLQGDTEWYELSCIWDVEGDCDHAQVWAGRDGSELRLVDGNAVANRSTFRIDGAGEWLIEVRPFNAAGRAGQMAAKLYITSETQLPPRNPGVFAVLQVDGGLRRFSWVYTSDKPQALAGVQIRYLPGNVPVSVADWDRMQPLGAADDIYTAEFETTKPDAGEWTFALRAIDTAGQLASGLVPYTKLLDAVFDDILQPDLTPPPTPTGFAASAALTTATLQTDLPSYEMGHGHATTNFYVAEVTTATPNPAFGAARLAVASPEHVAAAAVELGKTYRFWAKWKTVDGVESEQPSAPVTLTVGKVGNSDLGDLIVEAGNLADGAVNASKLAEKAVDATKFANGIEPVGIVTGATLPTVKTTSTVVFGGKLYRWDATTGKYTAAVPTTDLTGQINSSQLADNAVTVSKIAAGAVDAGKIAAGAVGETHIANLAITAAKVADNAVTVSKIADGAVQAGKLASNAVTADKIAASAVDATKFASGIEPVGIVTGATLPTVKATSTIVFGGKLYRWDTTTGKYTAAVPTTDLTGQINSAQLADNAVTVSKIAAGAVDAGKIAAGAVGETHLANLAVTAAKVADNAVTVSKIAAGAVDAGKIAAGAVGETHIANLAITAAKVADNAVTVSKIADGAVQAGKIVAGAVRETHLANLAVTAAKVADNAVTVSKIADGAVDAGKLASNAVTADKIAASAVDATKFASGIEPVGIVSGATLPTVKTTSTIVFGGKLYRWSGTAYTAATAAGDVTGQLTDAQLAAISAAKLTGQITGTQITDGAISTPKIAAGAVSASQIAAGAVTAGKIAANAVSATEIAAGAITAGKIAANAVTAGTIAADAVTAGAIAAGAVNAREIAANAITTDKLVVGSATNLLADGDFAYLGTGWNPAVGGSVVYEAVTDGPKAVAANVMRLTSSSTNASVYNKDWQIAQSVVAGTVVRLKFSARKIAGTSGLARMEFVLQGPGKPTLYRQPAGSLNLATAAAGVWAELSGTYAVEDGYTTMGVRMQIGVNGAVVEFAGASMVQMASGELIVDGAVTADKIAAKTITAAQIFSGAVTTTELAANSVTTAKIAANAVTATQIAAGTITAAEIASGTITADRIAAKAITAAQIAANAITATELAANSVTTAKIAANAVTATQIAAGTVTATEIASGAITTAKIAANAITAAQIAAGTITAAELAANSVTTAKIAANAVTATQIAAGTITAAEIASGAITTAKIAANAVTAAQIAAGTITAAELGAGSVTTAKVAAGAITANEIATNAITAVKIAAGAVTAGKIAANAVTANEIAASAITTAKIAAGAVSATEIAAKAITAAKLAITDTSAVNLDPMFEDASFWLQGTAAVKTIADGVVGPNVWADTVASLRLRNENRFTLDTSKTYLFEVWYRKLAATTGRDFAIARFFDAAGAVITTAGTGWPGTNAPSGNHYWPSTSNVVPPNVWTRYTLTVGPDGAAKFPPGVVACALGSYFNYSGSGTAEVQVNMLRITEMARAELVVDGAITADKIAAKAITAAQIAAGAITATELGANAVTAGKIAANAVTATQIAAGTITAAEIASGTITADRIAAKAITAAQIAANAITATELAANSVTTAKIAANAVTATQIAAGTITAAEIASGAITTAKIAANAVTAAQIAAGTITAAELGAGSVTTAKVAAGAITANEIATNAITAVKIAASAVTTDKIATNAVTANEIAANAITTAKIAAGAVNAAQIAAGAITATKMTLTDTSNIFPDPDLADPDFYTGDGPYTIPAASGAGYGFRYLNLTGTASSSTNTEVVSGWFQMETAREFSVAMVANVSAANAGIACSAYLELGSVSTAGVVTATRRLPIREDYTGTSSAALTVTLGPTTTAEKRARLVFIRKVTTPATATARFSAVVIRRAVSAELIVDGAIIAAKLSANAIAVGTAAIQDGAIVNAMIGNLAADKITAGTLAAARIAAGSIDATKLAALAVTAGKIAANAVTATEIAAGAITAAKLSAGAVTADKISVATLSAMAANLGTVTAGRIQNAANTTFIDLNATGATQAIKFGNDLSYSESGGLVINRLSVIGTNQLAPNSVSEQNYVAMPSEVELFQNDNFTQYWQVSLPPGQTSLVVNSGSYQLNSWGPNLEGYKLEILVRAWGAGSNYKDLGYLVLDERPANGSNAPPPSWFTFPLGMVNSDVYPNVIFYYRSIGKNLVTGMTRKINFMNMEILSIKR